MKRLWILFCFVNLHMFGQSTQVLDDEIMERYEEQKPWGMSVSIDLYDCNDELIRDPDYVKHFMIDLVEVIEMKAYGEPIVIRFGENPKVTGLSAVQLIETSNITAHFADFTNAAYIDIFSCKVFHPHKAGEFCKRYFQAEKMKISPIAFRD